MPIVTLPDGVEVEFPDGMSNEQIASAIQANFPQFAPKKSLTDKFIDGGAALGDSISNSFGGMVDDVRALADGSGTRSVMPVPTDAVVSQEPSALRRVPDIGISALKSAIAVPEAVMGIADIQTLGLAGKAAHALGFRPDEARAALDEYLSPQQKAADKEVRDAKGFVDTVRAGLENPSVIGQKVVESLAPMGAGGVLGRGLKAVIPKIGSAVAAAVGEGVVAAGSAAEATRQKTDDGLLSPGQAGAAVASGVGTAAFGAAGARVAQKLGIADVDTLLVAGAKAGTQPVSQAGVMRRIVQGGIAEGVFEEMPQSAQETVWQNAALGKPLLEGVPESAAMGVLTGGVMGGGTAAVFNRGAPDDGAAAAEAARTDALAKADEMFAPLRQAPAPTIADIQAASTIDEAIAAARAVTSQPIAQPGDIAAELDALEAAAGMVPTADPAVDAPAPQIRSAPAPSVAPAVTPIESAAAPALDVSTLSPAQLLQVAKAMPNEAAGRDASAELARLETEFAYQQREAAKEADFTRAAAQKAEQDVAQADALTAAQGFDAAQAPTVQSAMQQATARLASLPPESLTAMQRALLARFPVEPANDQNTPAAGVPVSDGLRRSSGTGAAALADPTQGRAGAAQSVSDGQRNTIAPGSTGPAGISAASQPADAQPALTQATPSQTAQSTPQPPLAKYAVGTKYHQKVPEVRRIKVANLKAMNALEVSDVSEEVAAGMDFSEPIEVSVFADGEMRIVDGHHRVAAARKRGVERLPVNLQAINARGEKINELISDSDLATDPLARAIPQPAPVENAPAPTTAAAKVPRPPAVAVPAVKQTRAEKMAATIESLKPLKDTELKKKMQTESRIYVKTEIGNILRERQAERSAGRSQVRKSVYARSKKIDTERDGMEAAIAKMGGLELDGARRRFGLRPEELAMRGNGIQRVFTGKGMSIDRMGSALAELGYVDMDENGKYDMVDFEEKLQEILGGGKVLTADGWNAYAAEQHAAAMAEVGADSEQEYDAIQEEADSLADFYGDMQAMFESGLDANGDLTFDLSLLGDELTESDIDEIFADARAPEGTGREAEGNTAEPAPQGGEGSAAPRPRAEEDFRLAQASPAELRARADEIESADQAERRASADADAAARADRDRRDIAARQNASAENFELGQDPDDSLSGQGPLFSKSPARSGAFGPIFTQYQGDAVGAIARLKRERTGEAVGALNHPELGPIDLVWGKEGTGASDGYGLAKLLK
ncbi:MAG TPA: hypothetical protein VIT92_00335, partial [Burkholderiaceae bacterium]